MTKRLGIASAAAILLAGLAVGWRHHLTSSVPRPQGVVLWVIDTCRADHLGMYGSSRPTTPFLDRLAREGTVYERCFAQAPWTKPSVAALLSGRSPASVGIWSLLSRLPDAIETLPEAMAAAGYHTAAFSTNPIVGAMSNYTQGFDEFVEAIHLLPSAFIDAYASGSAEAINRRLLPWLSTIGDRPFFLFIQSVDPHEEYKPAPQYLERFAAPGDEARYRREWQALKQAHPKQLTNRCTAQTFADAGVDPAWFIDYGERLYDADLLATDAAIERFWHHLESLGLADRVLLVVTADHGEEFLDHGATSHGYSLYNELLHVPLILRAPGLVASGRRVSQPVALIDVYPTVLALLGIAAPDGLDGRPLPGSTGEADAGAPHPIYAQKHQAPDTPLGRYRTGSAISAIEWPWKLVLNTEAPDGLSPPARELFDLERDPAESINLVDAQPARAEAMAARLKSWAADQARRSPPTPPGETAVPPAVVERLRQLGYAH